MNCVSRLAFHGAAISFTATAAFAQHYQQTNLQSNAPNVAQATDAQLVNPWGMTRTSGSVWWVADQGTGVATLYDGPGDKQSLVVTIPPANPAKTPNGSPTGTVANGSTTDFLLGTNEPAIFMFATTDGTIAAWNPKVGLASGQAAPSTHAVTKVKMTDGSAYTGLTIAAINGQRYLYAANFAKGRVDVFNNAFQQVNPFKLIASNPFANDHRAPEFGPFYDAALPPNFVPFNVQAIGNDIVVTFVLLKPGAQFETDGPGLGYVDVFSTTGLLLTRLEHGPWLNAPWGVAQAPLDFGRFSHDLLVGQFAGGGNTESSGFIAAYDMFTGRLDGLLEDENGNPIAINGIWSLGQANSGAVLSGQSEDGSTNISSFDPDEQPASEIYFTAGPKQGTGGLFGYLNAVSSELIQGSVQ